MSIPMILTALLSGLASPTIFLPGFAVGWFARRWWQLPLGAVIITALNDAEVMLVELPGATPDWSQEPLALIPPLLWCGAGFGIHAWQRRSMRLRYPGPLRPWPVIAGMVLGALGVTAVALGVALLYLRQGQLAFHTLQFGEAAEADYETIFFQYLLPGLLLGQVAGGLVGRVVACPRRRNTEAAALPAA